MVGGEGDDQLWGSGRGAIAGCHVGCHCSVLWWGKGGLWGSGRGALLGAIAGCQFLFHIFLLYSGPPISRRRLRKQQ